MTNRFIISVLIICIFSACSSSPKFAPNEHILTVGKAQSEQDISECLDLAKTYSSDSAAWKEAAGATVKGGVIGSAAGAVGGAIVHSAGRGVAVGAATGAVSALLSELWSIGERDPSEKRFAEYCLSKRGYEVMGWR